MEEYSDLELQCHTVAGVMETTKEACVVCLVEDLKQTANILKCLIFKTFVSHDINFIKTVNTDRFAFKMPNGDCKEIIFTVGQQLGAYLQGRRWPVVNIIMCDELKDTRLSYQVGEDGEG